MQHPFPCLEIALIERAPDGIVNLYGHLIPLVRGNARQCWKEAYRCARRGFDPANELRAAVLLNRASGDAVTVTQWGVR